MGPENPRLPFETETDLERRIVDAPDFQAGIWYGRPRHGHPEGAVAYHVRDVLANVETKIAEKTAGYPHHADLRLIAIAHDTFKYAVDKSKPKAGANHHGAIAARFLERFQVAAPAVLVTELHDDAFNAWNSAKSFGKSWSRAEERARGLLERLGSNIFLYLDFFECDNGTEGKTREPFNWFLGIAMKSGRLT